MSIEFKLDTPNLQAILARLKGDPKHVIVGVIGSAAAATYVPRAERGSGTKSVPATLAQIATWNHFGTTHIPARPFFTETSVRHREDLDRMLLATARGIAYGKLSWDQGMTFLGQDYTDRVKATIQNSPPGAVFQANADETIQRKGSSRPLIDTGQLIGAITYSVQAGP